MSTLHLERPVTERSRPGQGQERRHASPARERIWARVETHVRLTAAELMDAMVRPREKVHHDFSAELARAGRWFSASNRPKTS